MTDCVICIRRDTEHTVCGGCRLRISLDLAEIPDLHTLLHTITGRADQPGQLVSGTPEPPAPINIDVLDLLAEARVGNPTPAARQHPEDLLGEPSVASVLDAWVRDWREERAAGENLPEPYPHVLAGWLRVRLDWACDHHAAVDEFADEIRGLASRLRGLLALKRRVEMLRGAACPTCDTRSLFRTVDPLDGASKYIECGGCGRLWNEDEYERLGVILVDEDTRRTDVNVAIHRMPALDSPAPHLGDWDMTIVPAVGDQLEIRADRSRVTWTVTARKFVLEPRKPITAVLWAEPDPAAEDSGRHSYVDAAT